MSLSTCSVHTKAIFAAFKLKSPEKALRILLASCACSKPPLSLQIALLVEECPQTFEFHSFKCIIFPAVKWRADSNLEQKVVCMLYFLLLAQPPMSCHFWCLEKVGPWPLNCEFHLEKVRGNQSCLSVANACRTSTASHGKGWRERERDGQTDGRTDGQTHRQT